MRRWLWLRLTPAGRCERAAAKAYEAMLQRHQRWVREHADEIRARAPRRTIALDCLTVGCRWGDAGSRRCECSGAT